METAVFRRRSRAAWVEAAKGRDACLAPVLTIDEAPQHPQMLARRTFTPFDGVLHPSPAPKLSATPGTLRRPAPLPGQHQAEVLQEWGAARSATQGLVGSTWPNRTLA